MIKTSTLVLLGFILVLTGIELDIFLPTLVMMQREFGVTDQEITWVVTINLIGFAFSTVVYGPLSDAFGRRPVILLGLFLFLLGSLGCRLASNLPLFLGARFVQGIGCGAPLTICFTIVLDMAKDQKKAAALISLLNSLVVGATMIAPTIGAYIGTVLSWKTNFSLLTFGALAAWLMTWLFLKIDSQKSKWDLKKAVNQYLAICYSKKAWHAGLIPILMYSALLIYLVNFPLLAHPNISDIRSIGYLQSYVMLNFVFGSIAVPYLISRVKFRTVLWIAYLLAGQGSILLLIGSYTIPHLWYILTFFMGMVSAGTALVIGLYIGKSLDIFPEIRGTSASFQGTLRLTVSSLLLILSGFVIGEHFPYIALLICLCVFGSCFLCLRYEESPNLMS